MPKNKVDSSIDIVVQVMDEAQQRHREQFGNALMEKIAEHTDKTIHQKLVLPNDITRFSPLWQAERRYLSYKRAEVLKILVDKAIPTNDGWLMSVELDVKDKAELQKITEKLESLGCISNVQLNGWNRVQCKVNFDIIVSIYLLYLLFIIGSIMLSR